MNKEKNFENLLNEEVIKNKEYREYSKKGSEFFKLYSGQLDINDIKEEVRNGMNNIDDIYFQELDKLNEGIFDNFMEKYLIDKDNSKNQISLSNMIEGAEDGFFKSFLELNEKNAKENYCSFIKSEVVNLKEVFMSRLYDEIGNNEENTKDENKELYEAKKDFFEDISKNKVVEYEKKKNFITVGLDFVKKYRNAIKYVENQMSDENFEKLQELTEQYEGKSTLKNIEDKRDLSLARALKDLASELKEKLKEKIEKVDIKSYPERIRYGNTELYEREEGMSEDLINDLGTLEVIKEYEVFENLIDTAIKKQNKVYI